MLWNFWYLMQILNNYWLLKLIGTQVLFILISTAEIKVCPFTKLHFTRYNVGKNYQRSATVWLFHSSSSGLWQATWPIAFRAFVFVFVVFFCHGWSSHRTWDWGKQRLFFSFRRPLLWHSNFATLMYILKVKWKVISLAW